MPSLNPLDAVLLSVALVLFPGTGAAQTGPQRNDVVGITRAPATVPGLSRQRVDYGGCAISGCALPGFAAPQTDFGGGAAVNGDVPPNLTGSLGGVWLANDTQLIAVDPVTCAIRCPAQPAPLVAGGAVVTGLAYWEDRAALLMSDNRNQLYWIDTRGCQLQATVCDRFRTSVVPSGFTIGGLATDDVDRRLFVAASAFGSPSPQTRVYMTSLAQVQRPAGTGWCAGAAVCEMAVPTCAGQPALGAVTGLGYDACTETLYLTDGRRILAARFDFDVPTQRCSLTALGCCDRGSADPLGGLAVDQKAPIEVGVSCVQAPCIDCPTLRAGTYGAAFLGNRNFALTLTNAPTGATPVVCAIGAGGCVLPGVSIGFCATAKLDFAVPPLLIPARVRAVGGGPCDGEAVLSIGIPPIPAFCGAPLAVQWVMDCRGPGGAGNAISNCLTFEVTTN